MPISRKSCQILMILIKNLHSETVLTLTIQILITQRMTWIWELKSYKAWRLKITTIPKNKKFQHQLIKAAVQKRLTLEILSNAEMLIKENKQYKNLVHKKSSNHSLIRANKKMLRIKEKMRKMLRIWQLRNQRGYRRVRV